MKLSIKICLILTFIFTASTSWAAIEESPIKGFIYENLTTGQVKLTWHNSIIPGKTLIIGSDSKINWKPKAGHKYRVGETIDKSIHILGITEDTEFTTSLLSDNRATYYKAYSFSDSLKYSYGRSASEKIGMTLQITLVGMTVVFVGLIILVIMINLLGKSIDFSEKKHAELKEKRIKNKEIPKPHPQSFTKKIPERDDRVAPETIAVISAAITAYLGGRKYKIKSVRRSNRSVDDQWIRLSRIDEMIQQ